MNNVFTKLASLSTIKKRELILPIAKLEVFVSPLLVSDDLQIRSSIVSPDNYDNEICSMIFKHTQFKTTQLSYNDFLNKLTLIDKQVLLWGILNSTYKTISDENVKCSKCGNVSKVNINYDDLLHEDSLMAWEEDKPVDQFIKTCNIDINSEDITKLEIDLAITSLQYRISTLRLVSTEKIKENYNSIGSIFTIAEQLTSITKEIRVFSPDSTIYPINNLQEIHMAYYKLTHDIIEKIRIEYEYFNKYIPSFYTNVKCINCENITKHTIDPEVFLFRNYFRWAQS